MGMCAARAQVAASFDPGDHGSTFGGNPVCAAAALAVLDVLDEDTISAATDKGRYIRRERYCGECSRSFYIGDGITEKDVSAKFEDGILKLSIPKKETKALPKPNQITIE